MDDLQGEEVVAYSVQQLGGRRWRWRVYRAGGAVTRDGVEATRASAERSAAALLFGHPLRQAG